MSMLQNALAFAARGWPVFPCHPESKQPLLKGDHDSDGNLIPNSGGVKKASCDDDQVRAWWKRWPSAMIGLPTGRAIGAFVVDIDAGADKTTGEIYEAAGLQIALETAIGVQLPPTLFCNTPRGGVHLYYALPDGAAPGNRTDLLGKKSRIDIRGEGGYVIAPPSLRKDGNAYQWGVADDTAPAIAPAALLDLVFRRGRFAEAPAAAQGSGEGSGIGARAAAAVKPPAGQAGDASIAAGEEAVRKYGLSALDAELQAVRGAQTGGRNDALNIAALKLAQLVAAGALNEAFVRAALENAAAECGLIKDDGLRAVRATIESGFRKGRSQPRDLNEIRRAAADRERRPPRDASAVRSPSASLPSASSAAPAPPPEEDGEPSSQTGATASNSAPGGPGDDAPAANGPKRKPPRDSENDDDRNMRLAFFPLTDLGNAERFRERWKNKLKYNTALGWLVWDGKRWSSKGADELVMIAEHETVRAIQQEADAVRDSGRKDVDDAERGARDYVFQVKSDKSIVLYSDKVASWGRSSEAVNKLGALSKRGAPYFAVGIEQLDADKMKINVANGTLSIARRPEGDYVQFGPHDPDDLITKISPVDFDPNAACPEYDKFLGRVQPRDEMRRFLHQWGGYSLIGDVSEQILAFFYGKGGNGKSLLIDCWSMVAGDYGETLPIETFLDQGKTRSGGQATPDLALLPGVRLLRTSEPEKGSKLAESMVKLVTGGEPIQARKLNKDFFRFYPQFKLTISGNYRPTISGTDEGIWRRMRLVPFDVSIPKPERDRHLIDKLRLEASGILNHLLDGLRDWCDSGLIEPDDVTKATAKYRETSDPLGRFLSICVAAAPGEKVQSSVLHALYEAWCKSSGEKAWTNRGFSQAMDERGFTRAQSNVMWWHDIKMTRSINDFVDHEGHALTFRKDSDQEETRYMEAGDAPF